jgi:hypothetical protein
MKRVFPTLQGISVAILCSLATTTALQAATEIIDGFNASVKEIAGPDDLHLDPATAIIAVDNWGDEDREVNGILFQEDRSTDGVVEKNGVKVTTSAANKINDWAAFQEFTGGEGDSAENLGLIMQDIRWHGAPNPVTVEVTGLPPNTLIEVQLLTNEGADRNRRWDIGVGDFDDPDLVIDDYTSEGISADSDVGEEGVWTPENSFVATIEATSSDTGDLVVVMRRHIGGQDPPGGDNNPILQAVILHRAIPAGEPALIIEEEVAGNQAFEGALGMDFIVNLPIQVVQLGAFDSGSDELAVPITVELWSRDDGGTPDVFNDDAGGEILASLEFEEGDTGILEGGTRFLPLADPVVLLPGAYTIVGWGYGPDEQNYNVGGRDAEAEGLTITESDFITFVGGSRFGDPGVNGEWPTSLDGGPENRYGSGNFKFASTGDTDGDGMPDAYEEDKGFDKTDPADAALDADGDTLTNLEEFTNGTDPKSDDTDKDGLKDNVETNTGTWVSVADTGTNPKNADSDRDGLNDGVETNTNTFVSATDTGTDPNKKDSDGGGVGDGTEVLAGTDPTNPNSEPGCESPILNGGSITEFTSPDDLHLDPATVVIAVDVYGDQIDEGREINGVTFFTDRCDECADTEGMHEQDGVTYRAESTHYINGWAGPPNFSGGDGDSADELAGIMEDIRWSAAPSPVLVDIEGLNPGATYEVQLLVNEGADRNRRWDIGIGIDPDIELVVDDFTSEGCRGDSGGTWSPDNSFVYTFEVMPSADGIINIVMQQHIDGEDPPGGDNNPILQGVIVHKAGAGTLFQITNIDKSPNEITLTWASLPGREYSVEFIEDFSEDIWIELDDGVQSEGEETSFTDDDTARTGLPEGWYRVRDNSG